MALFWMNEQSGQMKEIVMNFLQDIELSKIQLEVLKNYIIQWIEKATITRPPDYHLIIMNSNQKELNDYIGVLLDYGIDPF